MNARNRTTALAVFLAFVLFLSACTGISPEQAQATANAAVLTAKANDAKPAAATQLPAVNPTSMPNLQGTPTANATNLDCASSLSEYMSKIAALSTQAELLDYYAKCGMYQTRQVVSAPSSGNLNFGEWEYFAQFSQGFTKPEYHGALIDKLDTLYVNVNRDFNGGATITTSANEVVAVWTGLYPVSDITLDGKLIPFVVEGKTGVYLVIPNTTVTIPTPSAWILLNNWTGETAPRDGTPSLAKGTVKAETCAANKDVESDLKQYAGQPTLFSEMDKTANNNANARVRNGWWATIQNSKAGKTTAWTKLGEISAGWLLVDQADGMGLYVAKQSGSLEVYHPFSGVELCDTLPNYENLHEAQPGTPPATGATMCASNAKVEQIFDSNWQKQETYAAFGLLPMAVYPKPIDGKFNAKWNTFVVSRDGMPEDSVTMPINWWNENNSTFDGFAGISFVKTDGVANIEASYSVVNLCNGPFSPADQIDGWGK